MRMPNTGIYNAAVIIVRVCILLYFYIKKLKKITKPGWQTVRQGCCQRPRSGPERAPSCDQPMPAQHAGSCRTGCGVGRKKWADVKWNLTHFWPCERYFCCVMEHRSCEVSKSQSWSTAEANRRWFVNLIGLPGTKGVQMERVKWGRGFRWGLRNGLPTYICYLLTVGSLSLHMQVEPVIIC